MSDGGMSLTNEDGYVLAVLTPEYEAQLIAKIIAAIRVAVLEE